MSRSLKLKLLSLISVVIILCFQNCSKQAVKFDDAPIISNSIAKTMAPGDCLFANQVVIPNGESIKAYMESVIAGSSSCEDQSEIRQCQNGILSGEYKFPSCSNDPNVKKSCLFNGQVLQHGERTLAYLNSVGTSKNGGCKAQYSYCQDGRMTSSYQQPQCSVGGKLSCTFNGINIASGTTVAAFRVVNKDINGDNICQMTWRYCDDGNLNNDAYTFSSCPKADKMPCQFDGKTISDGQKVDAYLDSVASVCQKQSRTCINGKLDGSYQWPSCLPYSSNSNTSGSNTSSNTNSGSNNTSNSTTTPNTNSTKSCMFNGKTFVHGQQLIAFKIKTASSAAILCKDNRKELYCWDGQLATNPPNPGNIFASAPPEYQFESCQDYNPIKNVRWDSLYQKSNENNPETFTAIIATNRPNFKLFISQDSIKFTEISPTLGNLSKVLTYIIRIQDFDENQNYDYQLSYRSSYTPKNNGYSYYQLHFPIKDILTSTEYFIYPKSIQFYFKCYHASRPDNDNYCRYDIRTNSLISFVYLPLSDYDWQRGQISELAVGKYQPVDRKSYYDSDRFEFYPIPYSDPRGLGFLPAQ